MTENLVSKDGNIVIDLETGEFEMKKAEFTEGKNPLFLVVKNDFK